MKENDKNVDNISFTAEANVVDNMEEELLIWMKRAIILVINVNTRAQAGETLRHILNLHEVVKKYNFEQCGYETGYLKNLKENSKGTKI